VQVDVDLDCLVIEEGRLNCAVAEERPPGQLYGEFARRLSHAYRIDSRVNGERTIGRRVRVPIEVTLSGPDDAPPGQSQAPNTAGLEALRALAAQAPSRAELDAAPLIQPAQWIERPNAQAFANHYPEDALLRRLEGRVALECLVVAEGRLRCAITEEDPADAGFGLAALGIAQDFRMAAEIDGQPTTGKRVRVALRFNAR
jgi:TonB family protein